MQTEANIATPLPEQDSLLCQGIAEGLRVAFDHILKTRMHDVPIINDKLDVAAVGFHRWNGHCLGVLVTPWCMNLMLMSCEGDEAQALKPGETSTVVFPSGYYDFITGEEEGIGRYRMCSLFSPMFEFEDQAAALATAEAALEALMDEANRDTISTHAAEVERRWRGEPAEEDDDADTEQSAAEDNAAPETPLMESEISRRDLLRGKLRKEPA